MDPHLTQAIRTAEYVIQAMKDAGIDSDDPDFETLVDAECEALERLRRMLRSARHSEAHAKTLKEMEAEMKERRTRFEARADTLRAIVKHSLEQLGMTKLDAPDFTASIAATRPRVEIRDEDAIPSQLCKFVKTPDKTAIRAALDQGEVIPGAYLSEPGTSLTLRTR